MNAGLKRTLLNHLLTDESLERVIIFTRTKRGANRVAEALEDRGVRSEAIHGNKSQNARQKALDNFSRGKARVLVATDLASRGIDVQGVTHVINFELPADAESYVHRIGRTARAGASGIAISFCDGSERGQLKGIERLTNQRIPVVPTPANEDMPQLPPPKARAEGDDRDDRATSVPARVAVVRVAAVPVAAVVLAVIARSATVPTTIVRAATVRRRMPRASSAVAIIRDAPRAERPPGDRPQVIVRRAIVPTATVRVARARRVIARSATVRAATVPMAIARRVIVPQGERAFGDRPRGDRFDRRARRSPAGRPPEWRAAGIAQSPARTAIVRHGRPSARRSSPRRPSSGRSPGRRPSAGPASPVEGPSLRRWRRRRWWPRSGPRCLAREFLPRGRSPGTLKERAHIGRALLLSRHRPSRRSRPWS